MDFGRNDYNQYFNKIYNADGTERESTFDDNEPVFLIRGGDPVGPQLLMEYAKQISLSGTDASVAKSAFAHAIKMIEWHKTHGIKQVDLLRIPEDNIKERSRIDQLIEMMEVDSQYNAGIIDELFKLFDKVYGPDKLKVLLAHEIMPCTEPPFYKPLKESDALLEIGVAYGKVIILKNKL